MTTPTWSHGYFTHDVYTAGFFRETAPNWLDFAALVQGAAPPRQREGRAFHYLDLGCGLARRLALTNLAFPEADLLDLQHDPVQRQALPAVASASLSPEDLFHCSSNTFPAGCGRSVDNAPLALWPTVVQGTLRNFTGSGPPFQFSEGGLKAIFRTHRRNPDEL